MRRTSLCALLSWLVVACPLAAQCQEPRYPDHADLSVYRDESGALRPIRTPEDWAIRRGDILAGMQEAMGPLPDRAALPPLDVKVKGRVEGDSFTRLTISLVPEPNDRLAAHLYLPRGAGPGDRRPAMLALHPTSPLGKDRVTTLGGEPNRGYADELAQRGYVVIAPDYPSFGDSKDYDFQKDRYASGTMKGIFNHMRCVDLLCSRPEVDPERIGAIGHSLGGHNAMFLGAFDPRVKVVVSCCGWTPFHDYYRGDIKGWTSDRYMPLLRDKYHLDPNLVPFDFYEVVAALAPRAFFSVSPLRDDNFDVGGVRKAIAKAQKVYELLGNPEGLRVIYPDSAHDFVPEARQEAYAFLDKVLRHQPPEPPRADGAESVLFVSPQGDDAWTGDLAAPGGGSTGPLASLPEAIARSRKLPRGHARRIVLGQGEYRVGRPVDLAPEDSGLSIEAAEGAAVVLRGGRSITGWRRDGDDLWAADLPEVKEGKWDFRMLEVNDRLCPRARLPKEGTFAHLTDFDVPWMSTTAGGWKRKPTQAELTAMRYRPEDLGPWLDIRNAEVSVYHMWDESLVGVAQNDLDNHVLSFASPCEHPPGAFGVQKYVVWNTREGLTEPGQWYLDRTGGKVVYWPLPGEDMAPAEAFAPTIESIVRIRGQADEPVRDVTLRGLAISVANTPLVAGGFGAGGFPGAIELDRAENCRLLDLEIKNVAGQGARASRVEDCAIENCHVHDTGACGLKFEGRCAVRDNLVHHVGRIYPSAIAVWGDGRSCTIEHNTVHDTPYTAIACGGDDHRIEHNRIHRAMQVLHDGAGIYISLCKRVVLRGNYIHDIIDTGGYGASAYYLDEGSTDCLVEGNLSVRVARPSHNHMARKNALRNNVFVCGACARLTFPKSSEYRVERNVIIAPGGIRVTRPEAIAEATGNIVFSASGKVEGVKVHAHDPLGAGAAASTAGWLPIDPGLLDYDSGRIRFAPGSPAIKLGIAGIDVSGAGRRK